ncbi:histone deacetylase family protein [Desulfolithobacter sp.]
MQEIDFMRKTAIYRDDLFLEHEPGISHPESPDRLRVIYEQLDGGEIGSRFFFPEFTPASAADITRNHDRELYDRVLQTSGRSHDFLDADTQTSARSYDAAMLAAGAVIDGIRRLHAGEMDNGFCLVRPPGHHAEKDRSMGFCLFNNVAVGARWALANLGLKRIFIIDWDLHHGNGTQHSFYETDNVLYCSTHQFPYYPGTGTVMETGRGKGEGFTVNVPLSGGQGDMEYARIFNELIVPVGQQFEPELILVSCGFDIYNGDPLGAMEVTPAGFAYLTRVMVSLAEKICNGRLLITLEGGYNLRGMRDGALAVLEELCGEQLGVKPWLDSATAGNMSSSTVQLSALDQAMHVTRSYWKI